MSSASAARDGRSQGQIARLTPAEATRRYGHLFAATEADIRAIRAAAGDDPVFAQLDRAKVCELLVKARRRLSIFGGVPNPVLERKRAPDRASLALAKHCKAIDRAEFAMMGVQERTFHKWAQLDEMERLMAEVDAAPTLYDNCPNRALMGKLMAFVVGKAVSSSALKGWMVRRRRFRE
jgi:hypothetical protein